LTSKPAFCFALLLTAFWLTPATGGAADLRRLESVGVFPIEGGNAGRHAPRDGAVRAAVARSVEGVALEILPEGWEQTAADPTELGEDGEPAEPEVAPTGPGDISPLLAAALGPDPFEYATRFRILDDRGVRDALFTKDPDVASEYVVVVEVFVDAGRVRDRLRGAGWVEAPAGPLDDANVRLVLQDLSSFGAYDAVRRTLLEELEVRSALPVELSRGRVVIEVDSRYDAESLLGALLKSTGDGLRVVPLAQEGQTLTLLVDWTAPPAAAEETYPPPPGEDETLAE